MAKTSTVQRNKKRIRMTKQFSARRAKLKAIIMDHDTGAEDRFEAVVFLY